MQYIFKLINSKNVNFSEVNWAKVNIFIESCSLDIRSILDWSNRDRSQTESDVRSSTTYSPPQTPYIDLTSTAKVTVKYQSLGGRTAKHPSSSSAAALATSYVLVTAVFYVTELLTSANLWIIGRWVIIKGGKPRGIFVYVSRKKIINH